MKQCNVNNILLITLIYVLVFSIEDYSLFQSVKFNINIEFTDQTEKSLDELKEVTPLISEENSYLIEPFSQTLILKNFISASIKLPKLHLTPIAPPPNLLSA